MPIESIIVLAFIIGAFTAFAAAVAYAQYQTRDLKPEHVSDTVETEERVFRKAA